MGVIAGEIDMSLSEQALLRRRTGNNGPLITEVERRILRACRTLRAIPDREQRYFVLRNSWPDVQQATDDAYGYTEVAMPKFRPKPQDVSDMLPALAWARGLEPREWRLIWWRSFDVSFRQIGFRIGRSDETARRWYKDAMLKVWWNATTNS